MQLLISTGSQRLRPRREPVVPSHYREVEAITNSLPHHRLLWTLVEGEIPALIELPNRISREHSKGQWRRRVRFTQSFDQLKHRSCLLHRLPPPKPQTPHLPRVAQGKDASDDVTSVGRRTFERMARLIPTFRTVQIAPLKPEHGPPPRTVGAADRNETMNQHREP